MANKLSDRADSFCKHEVAVFIQRKKERGEIRECANLQMVRWDRARFRPDCSEQSFIEDFPRINSAINEYYHHLTGCPPNCTQYKSKNKLKLERHFKKTQKILISFWKYLTPEDNKIKLTLVIAFSLIAVLLIAHWCGYSLSSILSFLKGIKSLIKDW